MIDFVRTIFKPVPCKNCITLSSCKALLSGGNIASLVKLTQKCSLFKEYVVDKPVNFTAHMPNHQPVKIIHYLYNEGKYRRIVAFLIRDIPFSRKAEDLTSKDGLTIAGIQDSAEIAYILKSLKLGSKYNAILKICSRIGLRPPPPPPRKMS